MEVAEFAKQVAASPMMRAQLQENPVAVLEEVGDRRRPLQTDVWIYRMVVGSLGLIALSAMLGALVLAMYTKEVPQVVVALGSGAIGAIGALLAPSPAR